MKQQFTEEEIYKDRDSQITAIEKTFEDAQKSVIEGLGWGEAVSGVASECCVLLILLLPLSDLPALQQASSDTSGGHACLSRF